ncbi:MAG: hypothetical protein NTW19_05665, partial [Planctomycetota bacterium]|nr:hypothetical protein [Planctomycetota bacterium]
KETTLYASKQLTAAFPALGPAAAHELSDKFEKALGVEAEKLRGQLKESLDTEMSRFRAVLEKFPVTDVSTTDSDTLTRRFLHSLTLLIDYHLLAEDVPGASVSATPSDAAMPVSTPAVPSN